MAKTFPEVFKFSQVVKIQIVSLNFWMFMDCLYLTVMNAPQIENICMH
jgi:hypothetical protein